MQNNQRVKVLLDKGVFIPCPESVYIHPDVPLEQISGDGVTLHTGCKLFGENTLILKGSEIGRESPVTIENCQLGPKVQLKGGYFKEAVFLRGSSMGSGAHVREGSILEEYASGAHTVGLKQTILFPFVTLGSLINFCDCLMSGGTNSTNHSEVGSSYIHFNYTPNQDKATASLLGDVPRGVMLDQPPIFLGGQGGMVGPCRLSFGTVVAAGCIIRKDELRLNRLLNTGGERRKINIPYKRGIYSNLRRVYENNIFYIGNLVALNRWYKYVRREFIADEFPESLLIGLLEKIDMAFDERIKRFEKVYLQNMTNMVKGDKIPKPDMPATSWRSLKAFFQEIMRDNTETQSQVQFLSKLSNAMARCKNGYIETIQSLPDPVKQAGVRWLQQVVDQTLTGAKKCFPKIA
jgi:UDP-N-acetylglucosamine/UDP-N-acetylgalactosamine diphosphorylase